jgi:hypothetical protein
MVNNRTYLEPDGVLANADHIGGLLDDQSPFETVSSIPTNSGNFPAAHMLDSLLADRGKALLLHSKGVQIACHEMKTALYAVVTDLEGTDSDNSNRLAFHDVNVARLHTYQQSQADPKA